MQHPLSLEAFRAWVAKQPEDAEWNYWDCADCAVLTYMRERGLGSLVDVRLNDIADSAALAGDGTIITRSALLAELDKAMEAA